MTKCIYNNSLIRNNNKYFLEDIKDIEKYNKDHSLGFDRNDIIFYTNYFESINRNPTNIELYDHHNQIVNIVDIGYLKDYYI